MEEEPEEEKKKRVYPTGPPLRSLKIFSGQRRDHFPLEALKPKQAKDVEDLIKAVRSAEADVYELRREFDELAKSLKKKMLHEVRVRKESLRINHGPRDTIDELSTIIRFTENLKL